MKEKEILEMKACQLVWTKQNNFGQIKHVLEKYLICLYTIKFQFKTKYTILDIFQAFYKIANYFSI